MRHNLGNIQSVNDLLPGTGLLALETCKNGSWCVSCRLKLPDHQKEHFHNTALSGHLPEVLIGAINHQKGDDLRRNGAYNVTLEELINELPFIVKSLANFYFKTNNYINFEELRTASKKLNDE